MQHNAALAAVAEELGELLGVVWEQILGWRRFERRAAFATFVKGKGRGVWGNFILFPKRTPGAWPLGSKHLLYELRREERMRGGTKM